VFKRPRRNGHQLEKGLQMALGFLRRSGKGLYMCILLRAGAAAATACMQAGRLPLLPLLTMRLHLQLVQHPCFHTIRFYVVSCSTTIMDGLALIPDARKFAVLERQHAKQEKQAELPFLPPSLCQIPDVWLDNTDFQFTAHCEGNRTLTVLAMQVSLSCRSTRCARCRVLATVEQCHTVQSREPPSAQWQKCGIPAREPAPPHFIHPGRTYPSNPHHPRTARQVA
jgi:hypothetical protein